MVPSSSEAFGLVSAEALAYGAIPVVSDVGGLPETIIPHPMQLGDQISGDDRWTGFVFPYFADPKLTGLAVKHGILNGVPFLDRPPNSRVECLHRLIASTPRERGSASGSFKEYANLMDRYV